MERAPDPKNDVAFSRGNSAEKIITDASRERVQPSDRASEAPKADNGNATGEAPSNPNALALPTGPLATIARNEPSRNPTLGGRRRAC